MKEKRPFACKFVKRPDLVCRVNSPELGRLRDADRARLRRMQFGLAKDCRFRFVDVDLAVSSPRDEQFRSGEKFRRATLVGLDVCMLMANDAVEWLAKLRQRQRIRCGTIENKKYFAIDFEHLAHKVAGLSGPSIIAVGWCRLIGIRPLQRIPSFGTNRCGVVAGELVAISAPLHLACLLREFLLRSNQEQDRQLAEGRFRRQERERLPDRPEPWASGARQANHLYVP